MAGHGGVGWGEVGQAGAQQGMVRQAGAWWGRADVRQGRLERGRAWWSGLSCYLQLLQSQQLCLRSSYLPMHLGRRLKRNQLLP